MRRHGNVFSREVVWFAFCLRMAVAASWGIRWRVEKGRYAESEIWSHSAEKVELANVGEFRGKCPNFLLRDQEDGEKLEMGCFGCDSVLMKGVPTQPKIISAITSRLSPIPWKIWSREKPTPPICGCCNLFSPWGFLAGSCDSDNDLKIPSLTLPPPPYPR